MDLEKITPTVTRKNPGYYDDVEHIIEEVSQCDSKMEFRRFHNGAYYACRKVNLYDKLCSCLSDKQDELIWKDIEIIKEESRKYSSMTDFAKHNGSAFAAAHRMGILDDVCTHMTQNKTSEIVDDPDIKRILNVALQCVNYDNFRKDYGEEYIASIRYGIMDIVAHTIPQGRTTISSKDLFELSKEYNNYIDFEQAYPVECRLAKQSGIITQLKLYFQIQQRKHIETKEQVLALASTCSSYSEFHEKYSLVYAEARRKEWLPDVFKILPKTKHSKYTKRKCISIAKRYKTRREFATKEPSAYNAVLENGWLNEIDKILPRTKSEPYDEEKIMKIVESCTSYSAFIKDYRKVYLAANRLKILERIKEHFHKSREQ